jgi:hypothetical protein
MADSSGVFSPGDLLDHWQGHRRLTRRVIEAFPETDLFGFSVGSMRPFGALALEILSMDAPMVRGLVTDTWDSPADRSPRPKAEVLRLWDSDTGLIDQLWPQIPIERFQETITAFGQYPGRAVDLLLGCDAYTGRPRPCRERPVQTSRSLLTPKSACATITVASG